MTTSLNETKSKLAKFCEENPVIAIVGGIAIVNAIANLMKANAARRNASSWDRESKRRVRDL